jgi:MFS family permease
LATQAVVATACSGAEEAFVQGFAPSGTRRLGAYVGVTHGLRGLADACGFLLAAVLSQLDVRWPWLLGACGKLATAALILALDPLPRPRRRRSPVAV